MAKKKKQQKQKRHKQKKISDNSGKICIEYINRVSAVVICINGSGWNGWNGITRKENTLYFYWSSFILPKYFFFLHLILPFSFFAVVVVVVFENKQHKISFCKHPFISRLIHSGLCTLMRVKNTHTHTNANKNWYSKNEMYCRKRGETEGDEWKKSVYCNSKRIKRKWQSTR